MRGARNLLFDGPPHSLAVKRAGVKGFVKRFKEGDWQLAVGNGKTRVLSGGGEAEHNRNGWAARTDALLGAPIEGDRQRPSLPALLKGRRNRKRDPGSGGNEPGWGVLPEGGLRRSTLMGERRLG